MKNLSFNDVRKMFDELLKKGYSVKEVLEMPIFVGGAKWVILLK